MMGNTSSYDVTWMKIIKGGGPFPVTVATISGMASKGKVDKAPTIVVSSLDDLSSCIFLTSVQVTRDNNIKRLDLQLQTVLQEYLGSVVNIVSLFQVNIETVPDRSFVISTLEQQQPLLNRIEEQEMAQLKSITDRVAKIVWVVNGGFVGGENPDFAPVLGLSRALMLEQPSLQFAVLDVDNKSASSSDTLYNIVSVFDRLIHELEPDFEFAQRDGVLHISRWEPDEHLNETFRLKQNKETIDLPLAIAGRCELGIKDPGQMDTIHFVQLEYPTALHPDHVEISVKSVGMNAKVGLMLARHH